MKPFKWVDQGLCACLTLLFILGDHISYAQCAAAPVAASTCTGGNGAASNGLSIGAGKTYWVSGVSSFSTLTLNGGILRICGILNLTSLNFTSGTLIVEAGGIVNISGLSSTNLNGNVIFINRGTISMATGFTFQNPGNAIYNDKSTSVFTIAGTITLNSAQIVNRGTMSLAGLYDQGATGNFCVQDQSVTTIGALTNVTTNSFSYSGLGSPACLNITGSANLNSNVTGSNKIHICKKTGVTATGGAIANPGGGWGSAVVTSGCSSCATVLALTIPDLTADRQGDIISLQWTTNRDLSGDEVFYVEKSVDGDNFFTLTTLRANTAQYSYSVSDASTPGTKLYYRVRAVSPAGASYYSRVVQVGTGVSGKFQIYPNPVRPNTAITLMIPSTITGTVRISLVDMAGKPIRTKMAGLQSGNNILSWDLEGIASGIYTIRVEGNSSSNLYLYGRISVR
jgi:hypothetical protein